MTVVSHIDSAIPAKKHPPMYLMQKYWARKPHNVVFEYIQHYSQPNEIVLDPFLGSGVTLIESLRSKRKAIGFDLDPFSILITATTVEALDLAALQDEFAKIQKELEKTINDLYPVTCPNCGKPAMLYTVTWAYVVNCPICGKRFSMGDAKRPKGKKQNIYRTPCCHQEFSYANVNVVDEEAASVRLKCPNCQKRSEIVHPRLSIPRVDLSAVWYPKIRFSYDGDKHFATRRRASTIEELFTARNLYALALVFDRILKAKDSKVREALHFVFASTVPQASKMMILTKSSGPSWKVPEYLIYPLHCEFNVWSRFENRFRTIKNGLEDSRAQLPRDLSRAEDFEGLSNGANYLLRRHNALEISAVVPADSVDYVFTDPPYGGAIQYFELDLIRVAWLMGKQNGEAIEQWWKEEITINRGQGKDFEYYHKMLSASFAEIYKVLKPEHYLTVTFHSTDIDVWNSIIMAVRLAGFESQRILYQSPAVRSAKGSLQPYGSAVGDYYIRFRKPAQKKEFAPEQVDRDKYRTVVIETTKHIIAERREATPFTYILNGIIPELDKQGVFFLDTRGSKGIEDVLRERVNIDFVLKPILDEKGDEVGQGWWFADPSSVPYLESTPLAERVERLVINILNSQVKVSFDDVLQQVFTRFPNALTPNTQSVKEVLDEYAMQTKDKKWMLKPKFKQRMSEHDTYVKDLADLGLRLGFDVHADIDGYRKQSFPFKVVSEASVAEIDVLWYRKNEAVAEFEVENTTGITEAIVRGGNIPSQSILRTVVMPEERIRFLRRKIREPIFNELAKKHRWKLITYGELSAYLSKYKKKQPKLDTLMTCLLDLVNLKIEVQESIKTFL